MREKEVKPEFFDRRANVFLLNHVATAKVDALLAQYLHYLLRVAARGRQRVPLHVDKHAVRRNVVLDDGDWVTRSGRGSSGGSGGGSSLGAGRRGLGGESATLLHALSAVARLRLDKGRARACEHWRRGAARQGGGGDTLQGSKHQMSGFEQEAVRAGTAYENRARDVSRHFSAPAPS